MKISATSVKTEEKKQNEILDDAFATAVKSRDNWLCCICGTDYKPCAHHIIPRENKQFKWLIDNGISLCRDHHKFNRKISAHNNPLAFFLWLSKYKKDLFEIAAKRTEELLKFEGIGL